MHLRSLWMDMKRESYPFMKVFILYLTFKERLDVLHCGRIVKGELSFIWEHAGQHFYLGHLQFQHGSHITTWTVTLVVWFQ